MHPQLQQILDDYGAASRRLDALAARVPAGAWFVRPGPDRWSPGECVAHLNLTSTKFFPVIRDALARSRPLPPGQADRRLRRDPLGWFLWRIMPPPVRRMRVKAKPAFTPAAGGDPAALLAEFARLQEEMLGLVRAADGLAIDKTMLVSAIDNRARYNLFACLGILARHQHRHLWQAERAVG